MVGGENKLGSVFSWADEVEKEEEKEAAARTQIHEKQRPNPFGSARPREVVLQEKGIDWRKLDQNLQPPSRTRSEPPKDREKPPKENVPAPAAPQAVNHKQPFHPSWKGRQERKPENINTGSDRREVPQVLSTPHNHIPDDFVPPLSFPPKNVASLLKEERGSYNPHMSDSGQRSYQYKSHFEPLREKAFHESRLKLFHNSEIMDRSSYIHHLDQHEFDTERESQRAVFDYSRRNFNFEELRGQSMEALHGSETGKWSAREEGRVADSMYKRSKFFEQNLVGSMSVNERRGASLILDEIRWPSTDGREWENIQSDKARRDGRRRWYDDNSNEGKTGYGRNCNSKMPTFATKETNWEEMEYDKERQNITKKFSVSSSEAGSDGRGTKGRHNMKMKRANFGGNYRKQG